MERTEKIKNKFKNVSNLKLYKKVNRARFGMNLCFLLAFFTLFFFLVFLISMILENFVHLINILDGIFDISFGKVTFSNF